MKQIEKSTIWRNYVASVSTVQSRFSDIEFSGYFSKKHCSIYCIKSLYFISDIICDFSEIKNVES